VRESDQPPGEREDDPADGERHREDEQVESPLDVDHCRENVGEEASTSLVDVDARNVAFAVFADESALRHARRQPPETLLSKHRRHLARPCTRAQHFDNSTLFNRLSTIGG